MLARVHENARAPEGPASRFRDEARRDSSGVLVVDPAVKLEGVLVVAQEEVAAFAAFVVLRHMGAQRARRGPGGGVGVDEGRGLSRDDPFAEELVERPEELRLLVVDADRLIVRARAPAHGQRCFRLVGLRGGHGEERLHSGDVVGWNGLQVCESPRGGVRGPYRPGPGNPRVLSSESERPPKGPVRPSAALACRALDGTRTLTRRAHDSPILSHAEGSAPKRSFRVSETI
jgi:hypothetical protein